MCLNFTVHKMKETALTHLHIAMGAKMAPFADYNMPIEYSGIQNEHLTVCHSVGIFDVSHMGEIRVQGPQALRFLDYVCSNRIDKIQIGHIQYNYLHNGRGGIVDDLMVYRLDAQVFWLVVNASNTEKVFSFLCGLANSFGIRVGEDLINESASIAQIAVQGPKAMELLQRLCTEDVQHMPAFDWKYVHLKQVGEVMVSMTGYTGAGGCEVYLSNTQAPVLWNLLLETGKDLNVLPIGLGARDTLRLEVGYCLYGHELQDDTNGIEAGLKWVTDTEKEFYGKADFMAALPPKMKLVGLKMLDRGIPRQGYEVCDAQGLVIGTITSGTISPTHKNGIAMAYVQSDIAAFGTILQIKVREKFLKAEIIRFPYRNLTVL